jgi:hypothetical protein
LKQNFQSRAVTDGVSEVDLAPRHVAAPGRVAPVPGEEGYHDDGYHDDGYQPDGYETIGRSARRHPFFIAVITLLCLLAGAAIGFEHPVSYSAQAQLIVGRTSSLAEDQIPGLAEGVQGLASDYARLISSGDVITAVEKELHQSSVPGTLTATPIPQSSVIDVISTAPTKALALALANAGASALTTVVTAATNDTQAELQPLLNDYTSAENTYGEATAQANLLQHQLTVLFDQIGDKAPTAVQQAEESSLNAEIVAQQTKASTAQAQANTYYNQYDAAFPPLTTQEEMIQQTGAASYTGNTQKSYLEAAGLLGLAGGLVLGLAGAALKDSRAGRRQTRAPAR